MPTVLVTGASRGIGRSIVTYLAERGWDIIAAVRTDDNTSTPELARTRMIWDRPAETVYFEFEVNGDPAINTSQDLAVLTVANAAGTAPELFIRFQPLRSCSTVSNCTGAGSAIASSAVSYSTASVSGSARWSSATPSASRCCARSAPRRR